MSKPLLSTIRLQQLALTLALFASTCALAKTGATGTVNLDGVSWPVVDAVATLDGEKLEVVFAQTPFDRATWATLTRIDG